ncbi:MAG: PEP-CTERM sorting domain-containing protein [Opitutaceae bacterium]|jgi:hypothetical protein
MSHLNKILRRALLPVLTALSVSAAHAFTIDFNTGYTDGATVNAVDDPNVVGTSTWATAFLAGSTEPSASSVNPAGGTGLAMRISSTTSSTTSDRAAINLGAAGGPVATNEIVFTDPTKLVQVKFDLSLASGFSGTGGTNITYVRIGSGFNMFNSGNWFGIGLDTAGRFVISTKAASTDTGAVSRYVASAYSAFNAANSDYVDFGSYGSYVTVDLKFDPVAKTYTSLTIGGQDLTSYVGGWFLPTNGTATPTSELGIMMNAGITATFDIDNIVIQNVSSVPEPSTYAALVGVAALGFVIVRRRSRL